MSKLPSGWTASKVGDVVSLNPKNVCSDDLEAGFVPMPLVGTKYRSKIGFVPRPWGQIKKGYTHFSDGDVLLAKITPCFENGKAGLVSGMPNSVGAGSTEYFVNRPYSDVVDARYLLALFKTEAFLNSGELQMTGSVGHKRVPKEYLLDAEIPLAPFNEQKRIADKLDAVLARVDACRDRLDRIPAILKRFRQSVLDSATSGKLTEDWREQLSNQFLWKDRAVSDIAQVVDPHPSHRTPPEIEDGVPYISMGDINSNGEIDFDNARKVSHDVLKEHQARYKVNSGDFIFGKIGTIGKPTTLPIDKVYTVSANVLLIQADRGFVTGEYLRLVFSSPAFMAKVTENSAATSQSAFGIKKMRDARVQIPDLAEQTEIVRRVESLFAYADHLEARYKTARAQVEKLTPALLAKAFRGELVPQDPNDEPASELLARIAATKPKTEPTKRSGRKAKASISVAVSKTNESKSGG